ncbi:uncharacterized protein [Watersipora subatra]|uniref:uncharacterized protein n=1 Tax=Watersipora subatra TaxID=2589382 RepID=UPI00355B5CC4
MAARPSSGFDTREELTFRDVINITSNPPAQRSRRELHAISDWIQKSAALFADMDKDIVYNVMKSCKCQVLVKDTVVVRQGEKGDAFYIILHGKVSVYVNEVMEKKKSLLSELLESDDEPEKPPTPEPSPENCEAEEDKQTGPSVRQRFRRSLTKLKITQQVTPKLKKPATKPNPREGLGQKVAEMSDGRSFGELALLNSDNRREASCVTESDMKQKAGETILKQGQPYNGLFFLIEGEVKVTVNNSNYSKQDIDTANAGFRKIRSMEDNSKQRYLGHREILRSLAVPIIRRRGGYSEAESFQSNRHRDLCLSGPTITFGEVEHVYMLSFQILGINSYIQTIVTESSSKLFHINKENWERLLKLANNMGHTVSNPTLTALTEMAHMTWSTRLEKFSVNGEQLSCLHAMTKELFNHLILRTKSETPTAMSREERLFESLITSYLKDETPLISPFVEGGPYYRSLMKDRAELRKKQKDKRGNVKPPYSLQPLKNDRTPRSIATLKEQIKKYNSSDVDLLIPPTKRPTLDPITNVTKTKNTTKQTAASQSYHEPMPVPKLASDNQALDPSKPLHEFDILLEEKAEQDEKRDWYTGFEHITEQDENGTAYDLSVSAEVKAEPVLITETHDQSENVDLVQGKSLKFYSQYLKGRLDREHDKPQVDAQVAKNNRDVEKIEQKMFHYLRAYDGTTGVNKLHRIDESKDMTVLPGAKCFVERAPCKLLSKDFPLRAHEHVKRHIVEHV